MTGKPTTLRAAQGAAKKLVLPRWRKVPVNAVTPEDVRVWIAGLLRGDGERKPAAASYVRQGGLILHAVLKNAVGDRRIAYDPMDRVRLPKAGKSRDQNPLTIRQVYALADALTIKDEDDQPAAGVRQVDRALLLTLCFTGLRVGEALGIMASAVDFDARRIHIRRTYGPDQKGRIIEGTPKSGESRWVPIPPQIMGELLALCEGREPKQDIFTGPRGGTLHGGNWRRREYTPALKACGLYDEANPRTVHDLRHTFASLAVKAGANVKALQNALGHANASMTLDVYSHLFNDDLDALGEKLGGLGAGKDQKRGSDEGQRDAGTHQVHTDPVSAE